MNDKQKSQQELENRKLKVFIGKWHTTGDIYDKQGEVIGKADAIDTYTLLPENMRWSIMPIVKWAISKFMVLKLLVMIPYGRLILDCSLTTRDQSVQKN